MSQYEARLEEESQDDSIVSQVVRYPLVIIAALALFLMGMSSDDALASDAGVEPPNPKEGSNAPKDNLRDGPPVPFICAPDEHAWINKGRNFFSGVTTLQCAKCGLSTEVFIT